VGKQFDELSKAMARRVSRGDALRGLVAGTGVALLGAILPGRARADTTQGNSACAHFCDYVYGDDTPEADWCIAQAAHGTGACYAFGPMSHECQYFTQFTPCPRGSVCTNFGLNGGENVTCVPYA
jgi:hypothetical protein